MMTNWRKILQECTEIKKTFFNLMEQIHGSKFNNAEFYHKLILLSQQEKKQKLIQYFHLHGWNNFTLIFLLSSSQKKGLKKKTKRIP